MNKPPPFPPKREIKDGEQWPFATCLGLAVLIVIAMMAGFYWLISETLQSTT